MADMPQKTNKILLVDDDQFLLNMYAIKFNKNGYETEAVTSADKGLERLRSGEKYDAIIFDIVMPNIDGFLFAETIKKENLAPQAALIALTNQAQNDDIERGKSIGVDGYIVKASTIPSEVVKEVRTILEKKLSLN